MRKVKFFGWNEGFKKVQFTTFLSQQKNITLKDAKGITDRILEGDEIILSFEEGTAEEVCYKATQMGVKCEVS